MNHSWEINAVPANQIIIEATYKVDVCKKCGCRRLHKYYGGVDYRKTYLVAGHETATRPQCKTIRQKDERTVEKFV